MNTDINKRFELLILETAEEYIKRRNIEKKEIERKVKRK